MPNVQVSPVFRASFLAETWAEQIVSLLNPETDVPAYHLSDRSLLIRCLDLENEGYPWAPQRQDIVAALSFVKPDTKILVVCDGGISRSTALAISILVQRGMTPGLATQTIHEQSPNLAPNKLILRYVDDLLKQEGQFLAAVQETLNTFPKELILYCDDCGIHFPDEEGHNCPSGKWS